MIDYGYYSGMLSIGSNLDEETRDTYTQGDCYLLALELQHLGLGELVAVMTPTTNYTRGAWNHMAVRTPDGYILDADGLNEPGLTLSNYGDELPDSKLEAITVDEYRTLVGGQSESIHDTDEVHQVALKLQAWLAKVPPLAPLPAQA